MNRSRLEAPSEGRVKKVAALIGRKKADMDFIGEAIRDFDARHLHDAERAPWPPWPVSKQEKEHALGLAKALARLERQLQRRDYSELVERLLYEDWDQFHDWKVELKHWRKRFEPSDTEPSGLFGHAEPAPRSNKRKPSAPRFTRKHDAAAVAASILQVHCIPLKAGKTSVFCQVAAVVADDLRIYHQCRVLLKARNRGTN
jgi:hypothetical protein